MVIFNELRIKEDGACLIVDCEIENVDVYAGMYIDSIYIDYYKNTSSVSMPSGKAFLLWENKTSDTSIRNRRVSMPVSDLARTQFGISRFDDGLFYVIVNCGGTPSSDIRYYPCGADDPKRIGVVLDWRAFYQRGMSYVNSIVGACGSRNFCDSPDGFEDFIILWNALKLAISTCDWMLVKDLWEKFLKAPYSASGGSVTPVRPSGCGCGR